MSSTHKTTDGARGATAPTSANAVGSIAGVGTAQHTEQPPCPFLIFDIANRLGRLSPAAVQAFALVLDRFELGQRTYGAPSVTRNWKLDTLEELLDLCVYRGLTLACAPTLPTPVYSCTFPTDDVSRGLRELVRNSGIVQLDLSDVEDALPSMAEIERVAVFERMAEGYCRACGGAIGGKTCHCENDE